MAATVKCLACGHDNKVGEAYCAQCSSSLNLKLCRACEAVNADTAARCHSCGAQFDRRAAAAVAVAPDAKRLPAVHRDEKKPQARSGGARATVLWVVTALAAGGAVFGYYRYEPLRMPVATGLIAAAVEPKPVPVPVEPVAVSVERVAETVEPVSVPVVIRTPEPESLPQTPPVAVVAPAAAPVEPAIESQPRVTHTKAPDTRPASAGATGAKEAGTEPSAACPPGVAALGLCTRK